MSQGLARVTGSCAKLPPASKAAAAGGIAGIYKVAGICGCAEPGEWVWGPLLSVGSSLSLHNQSVQADSSEVKGKE